MEKWLPPGPANVHTNILSYQNTTKVTSKGFRGQFRSQPAEAFIGQNRNNLTRKKDKDNYNGLKHIKSVSIYDFIIIIFKTPLLTFGAGF